MLVDYTGEFGRQLGYKSAWRGGFVEKIDRFYPSSKSCSVCGLVNQELKLQHRFWTCQCGAEHDRDHNAAINIQCFSTTVGATESYAGGDRVSPELALSIQAVVAPFGAKPRMATEQGSAEAGSPPAFSGG